jgi:hypothetical protein
MYRYWYLFLAVLPLISGCAELALPGSRTILDSQTGSTLLLVTRPLVFARQRSDVAAFARDYATLVAVELDVAGNYSDYLLLYRWSTVDKRMSQPSDSGAGELQIEADGRKLVLVPLAQLPLAVEGRSELYYPLHADVVTFGYKADAATLRFIALSQRILVRMPQESLDLPFSLRGDGRASLAHFLRDEGVAQ